MILIGHSKKEDTCFMFILGFLFVIYILIPAAIIVFIIYLVNPNLIYKGVALIKNLFAPSHSISNPSFKEVASDPEPVIPPVNISKEEIYRKRVEKFSDYLQTVFQCSIPSLCSFIPVDLPEDETDDYIGNYHVVLLKKVENNTCKLPAVFKASYYSGSNDQANMNYIDSIIEKHGKQQTILLMRNGIKNTLSYEEDPEEDYKNIICSSEYIRKIYNKAENNRPVKGYYFVPYDEYYTELSKYKLIHYHIMEDAKQYYDKTKVQFLNDSLFRLCSETYSDTKGTYLRPYSYSDYYRCTGNIIRNAYPDILYNGTNTDIEFWVPTYTFSSYECYKHMLWNIYVPNTDNRAEQEIDCLVICEHGIFCIEVKNWSVPITCKDMGDKKWTTNKDESHLSPIVQNNGHILGLKDLLKEKKLDSITRNVPIYNMVAFLDHEQKPLFELGWNNMYKFYHEDHPDTYIGYDTDLKKIIKSLNRDKNKPLSVDQINQIYDVLISSCIRTDDEKYQILKQKQKDHEE